MIDNMNNVVVRKGNRNEQGEYLYTKEEMKELWRITDTSNPDHTIETKIGLSALFLHSKESGEIVKGSWRVSFLQNSLTWATFKELFMQSELGIKCLEVGAALFPDKHKTMWCDLIENNIMLMVEGPNTPEWGTGIRTHQHIRLTQSGLMKTEPIRIYLNNTKAFMIFEYDNQPKFDADHIKFEKLVIQKRD